MTTNFRILFTLTLSHSYYQKGCKDFEFILPADTCKVLWNGKLLVRTREGLLTVLYEAGEDGEALGSAKDRHFKAGLKLQNPYFSNFTDLPFDARTVTPLYQNLTSPTALNAAQDTWLSGNIFSHVLTDSARPVTVSLKPSDGPVLQSETITAADDRTSVSYNLTGQQTGVYVIEEQYPGSTVSRTYYSDPELAQQGVFGILDILIDPSFYTSAPNFQLAFTAKEETLKYYLVAKNYSEAEMTQMSVTDAGFTEESRPQVQFSKLTTEAWTEDDFDPALLNGDDIHLLLFRSQSVVSRQESARKKIQLKKHNDVLITHLPQPGPSRTGSDLIIHLSKPKP